MVTVFELAPKMVDCGHVKPFHQEIIKLPVGGSPMRGSVARVLSSLTFYCRIVSENADEDGPAANERPRHFGRPEAVMCAVKFNSQKAVR
jgi:hypothetical protein